MAARSLGSDCTSNVSKCGLCSRRDKTSVTNCVSTWSIEPSASKAERSAAASRAPLVISRRSASRLSKCRYNVAVETAARCNLNVVMIVNNNYSGGVTETAGFDRGVNFAKVAESMGCVGFRVERPQDIQSTLDKALAAGKPAIVEILSDAKIRAKRGWVPPAISGE